MTTVSAGAAAAPTPPDATAASLAAQPVRLVVSRAAEDLAWLAEQIKGRMILRGTEADELVGEVKARDSQIEKMQSVIDSQKAVIATLKGEQPPVGPATT